jgi:hypothetical protein
MMKKITMFGTIALLALGFATCASAEIFSFTGTLADSSTVTGAFSIDPVGGTILGVDLFVADDPTNTYNQITTQGNNSGYYLDIDTTAAAPGAAPALFLGLLNPSDPGTLIGYTGGGLLTGSFWLNAAGSPVDFTSGTISPVPEPRFGALLVIGLAGLGFLARRKLAAAQV